MLLELLLGSVLAAFVTTITATLARTHPRSTTVLAIVLTAVSGGTAGLMRGDPGGAVPLAVLIATAPLCSVLLGRKGNWYGWANVNFAALIQAMLVYLVYIGIFTAATAQGPIGLLAGGLLWLLQLCSLLLTLMFAFEVLDVLGRQKFPYRDSVLAMPDPERWPSICLQIPAYNEPCDLLEATIRQAMLQEYPGRWMVQVIDNNTVDEATWRPIEALCGSLGDRVQFIHLEDWPGYKSGALNEGTRRLPAWVEVIGVIDADYLIDPGFLRATARHFADDTVAFVQTPQHYREWQTDKYLAGLFFSYKYFFDISMASRHEHNAMMFCGTMGLIRRSALQKIGGWDEWCITEDSEASLRLLGLGNRGVYDARPYGAGLMPLSFDGLKKQRFRWAFGGVQILKKHGRSLWGRSSSTPYGLTAGQRFGYLAGSLGYFNELLIALISSVMLLASLVAVVSGHLGLPALTGTALLIPPLLLLTGVARTQWALRRASGCSPGQALRAYLVFFALSWIVARACVAAIVRKSGAFLRTPKVRGQRASWRAVQSSMQETASAFACMLGALALGIRHLNSTTELLAGLLLVQGAIYACAPLCGLWAEGVRLTPTLRLFARSPQNTGERPVRSRSALRASMAASIAIVSATALGLTVLAPAGSGTVFSLGPTSFLSPLGNIVPLPGSVRAAASSVTKSRDVPPRGFVLASPFTAGPSSHFGPGTRLALRTGPPKPSRPHKRLVTKGARLGAKSSSRISSSRNSDYTRTRNRSLLPTPTGGTSRAHTSPTRVPVAASRPTTAPQTSEAVARPPAVSPQPTALPAAPSSHAGPPTQAPSTPLPSAMSATAKPTSAPSSPPTALPRAILPTAIPSAPSPTPRVVVPTPRPTPAPVALPTSTPRPIISTARPTPVVATSTPVAAPKPTLTSRVSHP